MGFKTRSKAQTRQLVTKEFEIQFNGGCPFIVQVDGLRVTVFKASPQDERPNGAEKGVMLISWQAEEVFVPDGEVQGRKGIEPWPEGLGNTILLRTAPNTYVSVRDSIIQFEMEDAIVGYRSVIGNSNVPYPLARSKNFTYLFDDDDVIRLLEDAADPYDSFYEEEVPFERVPTTQLISSFAEQEYPDPDEA